MANVMLRKIAVLTTMLLMNQAQADVPLIPHQAEYKVRISVVSGRLNTELRRTETGYVANHVIRPTGFSKIFVNGTMNVTSDFAIESDGVRPDHYIAIDTIRDDPKIDLTFDWDSNEVAGTVGEENIALQLGGIAYDQVSIQYALMHDLLNQKVNKEYVLFDIDKMRVANVSDVGSKQIKTEAGEYSATGVRHQKKGSSRVTTLWCVEELGYLPAIIEQHRNGKLNFRATLVSYSPGQEASLAASTATSAQ